MPVRRRRNTLEQHYPAPEQPADRREDGGQRDRPHQDQLLLGWPKYICDGETEREGGHCHRQLREQGELWNEFHEIHGSSLVERPGVQLATARPVTMSRLSGWRVMTPMDRDEERSLVTRLRAGDTGAFD